MLKILILQRKLDTKKELLKTYTENELTIFLKRETLESSVDEAETDDEITLLEEEEQKIETELTENSELKVNLENEIVAIEAEIEELNKKSPVVSARTEPKKIENVRSELIMNRMKFFGKQDRNTVEELFNRTEVKEFMTRTRELISNKRAVTGASLLIPDVLIGYLRDAINNYSKLIKHVNVKPVRGTSRLNIIGAVPEGIWTEACAKLNEANIVFNQIQVDGFKVGAYIPVCNADLADSDIDLGDEVLNALAQGIGLAIDKAILYGSGVKMPVGILTRLVELAEPAYWGTNEQAWTDLHLTNVLAVDDTETDMNLYFGELMLLLGVAKPNYSDGDLFWAMNRQTYMNLQSKALTINCTGAIVSGMEKTMPIIGGAVEELDFIPDNHIIGGFGSLYLLAERSGILMAQSEHVQFIEDNTVFKATARYDGRPIFGEAFVAISLVTGDLPLVSDVVFAPDTANF